MNLAFQQNALWDCPEDERGSGIYSLIVNLDTVDPDPDSDNCWGAGWVPYHGLTNTYCYVGSSLNVQADTRPEADLFLAVQVEWRTRRDGGRVYTITRSLETRGGGHKVIQDGDALWPLLDAYRQACGAVFATDEQAHAAYLAWRNRQTASQS